MFRLSIQSWLNWLDGVEVEEEADMEVLITFQPIIWIWGPDLHCIGIWRAKKTLLFQVVDVVEEEGEGGGGGGEHEKGM